METAPATTLTCKAILFDMDGTLVDSTVVVEAGWAIWAKRHNLQLEEILAFSHGRPGIATMQHFLPGNDHDDDARELATHEETTLEGIAAVPGAKELIHSLHGHPWAIVTSAWRKLAETRVVAAGLSLPEILVPIDEISKGKPHPEGFLLAASKLGIAPADCLVFEDTRPGIDAGLSAGMQVVGILTTMPADRLKHNLLIQDFNDVSIAFHEGQMTVSIHHRAS